MSKIFDIAIIGSGPAGYTAAIYAVRGNRKTVVISGMEVGGQLTETSYVENFPGFPDKILGLELMQRMKSQVENLGGKIILGKITQINPKNGKFVLALENQETITARAVIVSVGATARWLGIKGEKELKGRGVSGCAICDGGFFKGKNVVVVGGGDSACEDALFLTKFANKIYLVHRRPELRAGAILQERIKQAKNITLLWNTQIQEVYGQQHVEGVVLATSTATNNPVDLITKHYPKNHGVLVKDSTKEVVWKLQTNGLFVAIGRIPSTYIFEDLITLSETGYVVTGNKGFQTMTNISGIFAAGDCVDRQFHQAVIAAGQGASAALEAEEWLSEQEMKKGQ